MNYVSFGYLDMSIIWLFCIFQLGYNILTFVKIKEAKNRLTWYKLAISYGYWTYPIIYAIYPMIISFQSDFNFGLLMLYLRIPPISATAILIISWTIYIFIHNHQVSTKENLKKTIYTYNDSNFKSINDSKYFFRKGIVHTNYKYEKQLEQAIKSDDIIKIVEDIQGWFISKDKFSWIWFKNKKQTQNLYIQIFENICYKAQVKLENLS